MSAASRERFADVVRAGGAAGDPDDVRLDLALLLISAEALPDDVLAGDGLDLLLRHGLTELDALASAVPHEGRDDLRVRTVLGRFAGEVHRLLPASRRTCSPRSCAIRAACRSCCRPCGPRSRGAPGSRRTASGCPATSSWASATPTAPACSSTRGPAADCSPTTARASSSPAPAARSSPSTCARTTRSTRSTASWATCASGRPPPSARGTASGPPSSRCCSPATTSGCES